MQQIAESSRFVITAEDISDDDRAEPGLRRRDRPSVAKTRTPASAALTSFGVRGKCSPLPTAASRITELSNGAGRPSCGGRRTAGSHIQDMTRAGRIIAAAAVGCAAGNDSNRAQVFGGFRFIALQAKASALRQPMCSTPGACSSPEDADFTVHHLVRPNRSFKLTRYGSRRLAAPGYGVNCPSAARRRLP